IVKAETLPPTEPTITISAPVTGALLNTKSVMISGTIENSPPDTTISIYRGEEKIGSTAEVTGNAWSVPVTLQEGVNSLYAKAADTGEVVTATSSPIELTVDTLRPVILLNSLDPKPDMSQISINTVFRFKISDANEINDLEIGNSLKLTRNGTEIPVELLHYDPISKEVIFETKEPLSRSTKYYVVISPSGVKDKAGNMAFPVLWSFTTESTPSVQLNGKNAYNVNYNGVIIQHESPHEVYMNNTNICGNCHSTHAASNPNLLDQKKNSETNNGDLTVDNYCMACHDGTVAPIPENSQSTHTHNADIDLEGKPNGSSCSSCHNPHSEWSENNPNLIQGHITYTHDPTLPNPDKPTGEISSDEQLCESCHEKDSADRISNPLVEFRLFNYKKTHNAIGIYEDYQLCLRCHNSILKGKNQQTADIAKYYDNLTEEKMKAYEDTNGPNSFVNREISSDEINFSRHIIKASDGSTLAGHIPCAECHDTHGSNNIKVLKAKLGHEDIQFFSAADTDKTTDGVLTATKEREFCKKCHNGTTAIYGVTGKKYDELRTEHKDYPEKPCSYCHGRGESETERALSAAHAPKKGEIPPQ
ncbi:MAG TPA: Ig-like domain-containing protein, partial [Bacillales bacterium]|nr:Ig-like domain-containing protein [Bacillales bacterium]